MLSWEIRASDDAKEMEINQTRSVVKSKLGPTQPAYTDRTLDEETNDTQISKNRRKENAPKHKQQVRIQTNSERPAGVPEADVTTDCNTDGVFRS